MPKKPKPDASQYENKNYTKRRFNDNPSPEQQAHIKKQTRRLEKQGWIVIGNTAYKKKKSGKTPGDKDPSYIRRAEDIKKEQAAAAAPPSKPNSPPVITSLNTSGSSVQRNSPPVIKDIKFEGSSIPESQDPALQTKQNEQPTFPVETQPMLNQEQRESMTTEVNLNDMALDPQGQSVDPLLLQAASNPETLTPEQQESIFSKVVGKVSDLLNSPTYDSDLQPVTGVAGAGLIGLGGSTKAASWIVKGAQASTGRGFKSIMPIGTATTKTVGSISNGIKMAQNTKTTAQTLNILQKAAISAKGLKWKYVVPAALMGALGSYPWASHLNIDNVIGPLMIARRDAREAGDKEAEQIANDMLNDVQNPDLWDKIQEGMPYWNVIHQARQGADVAAATTAMFDMIDKHMTDGVITDDGVDWDRVRADEEASQKRIQDHYAQSTIQIQGYLAQLEQVKLNQQADYWSTQRAEEYSYWKKQLDYQSKKEKEDAQALADIWFKYRKKIYELQDANRPSNLSFGLI